jgi:hypothetical protein
MDVVALRFFAPREGKVVGAGVATGGASSVKNSLHKRGIQQLIYKAYLQRRRLMHHDHPRPHRRMRSRD